ncbi:YaiI/YqxD family protein [Denitratisoma sp. agr-D3]
MNAADDSTPGRRIWVDADACPVAVKEILYRAAQRTRLVLILVANQWLKVPASPYIRAVQVPQGFDVADRYIAERVAPGDLVITADIPLAAAVIERQALALNPRGERYDGNNIGQLLDLRNFMDTLRASGVDTSGPAAFSAADRQAFAKQLDRLLAAK